MVEEEREEKTEGQGKQVNSAELELTRSPNFSEVSLMSAPFVGRSPQRPSSLL